MPHPRDYYECIFVSHAALEVEADAAPEFARMVAVARAISRRDGRPSAVQGPASSHRTGMEPSARRAATQQDLTTIWRRCECFATSCSGVARRHTETARTRAGTVIGGMDDDFLHIPCAERLEHSHRHVAEHSRSARTSAQTMVVARFRRDLTQHSCAKVPASRLS